MIIHQSLQQNAKYQIKNVVGGFLVQENNNHTVKVEEINRVTECTTTKKRRKILFLLGKYVNM